MRFLHTADWHLGQQFHQYDRSFEHQAFLDWLFVQLQMLEIDVLLVSGDVYDHAHPSAATQKMLYTFLGKVASAYPHLHVVVTAGNHDSAQRLEVIEPLLHDTRVHLVGTVKKDADGQILYDRLSIPLTDAEGNVRAWCVAVPFLRLGDYPLAEANSDENSTPQKEYAKGVVRLYEELYRFVDGQRDPAQPILAMGHLHAAGAAVGAEDEEERPIMGGLESISAAAFPTGIAYVALGHIHRAQALGGSTHIRYSGSPLPMSFSETRYRHQVVCFEIADHRPVNLVSVDVPVSVPLLRVPSKAVPLPEVIEALLQLPAADPDGGPAPFLAVPVLENGPDPTRRYQIESALADRHVRLVKIESVRPESAAVVEKTTYTLDELRQLSPGEMYEQYYRKKYGDQPLPKELRLLFDEMVHEINLQKQNA
jgi:exonuclease SbcD